MVKRVREFGERHKTSLAVVTFLFFTAPIDAQAIWSGFSSEPFFLALGKKLSMNGSFPSIPLPSMWIFQELAGLLFLAVVINGWFRKPNPERIKILWGINCDNVKKKVQYRVTIINDGRVALALSSVDFQIPSDRSPLPNARTVLLLAPVKEDLPSLIEPSDKREYITRDYTFPEMDKIAKQANGKGTIEVMTTRGSKFNDEAVLFPPENEVAVISHYFEHGELPKPLPAPARHPKDGAIKRAIINADDPHPLLRNTLLGETKMECRQCGEVFIAAKSLANWNFLSWPGTIESVTCPSCGKTQKAPKT